MALAGYRVMGLRDLFLCSGRAAHGVGFTVFLAHATPIHKIILITIMIQLVFSVLLMDTSLKGHFFVQVYTHRTMAE